MEEKLAPIHKKLNEHDKQLRSLKKDLRSVKKDQNVMLDMLDREQVSQRKRLDRVEEHLGLPFFVS